MNNTRLFDVLKFQCEQCPREDALAAKQNGEWVKYTSIQILDIVNQLSHGLIAQGIEKGDRVGIVSFNRPEWVFVDYAISQIGGISVPMYPNATTEDYHFIMEDSGMKGVFIGDLEIYEKMAQAMAGLSQKPVTYTFDKIDFVNHWKTLLSGIDGKAQQTIEKIKNTIQPQELVTIIYTSGTTGSPKGVMLSHHNILSNAKAVTNIFPDVGVNTRTLSFLPLCHVFERTAVYAYMQMGISIYYAESMDTIGENLKEVKPMYFATVPRLLEKVYEKILAKGYNLKGIKKHLFFWALDLGLRYELNKDQGLFYNLQLKMANKLVFNKWREALGNNIDFIVSGAAALQPRIARVFWAAKIKVLEAYGLTETSPGVSFTYSQPENARIGCVGPLLENIQVKIAEDGEILVKGPNVMLGYYKRPDLTAEVIDAEGWFHTGDIGEMAEGRFLKITDRKKEMFKTSGGKYIAPQLIENKFKESLLIEQTLVVGENQKFPAILIVPAFDNLRAWCSQHRLVYTTDSEMINHAVVLAKFEKEIENLNCYFAQYEQVKKFTLLPKLWTIEDGELTPTLKLRRKAIMEKYKTAIMDIYGGE